MGLAQGHLVSKWQSWDFKPGCLAPVLMLLSPCSLV